MLQQTPPQGALNRAEVVAVGTAPWWLIAVWQMLLLFLEVKYYEDLFLTVGRISSLPDLTIGSYKITLTGYNSARCCW